MEERERGTQRTAALAEEERYVRALEAASRVMRKHHNVLAALGPDTDAERVAAGVPTRDDVGHTNMLRALSR